jgi:hypothetical protein
LVWLLINYEFCVLIYSFPGKATGVRVGAAAAAPVEAAPAKEVPFFLFIIFA